MTDIAQFESTDLSQFSLAELAQQVTEAHRQAEHAVTAGFAYGIQAGELLIEVRRRLTAKEWREWVDENLEIRIVMANTYIRMAHYKDQLPDHITSWNAARDYLRGMPKAISTGFDPAPEDVRAEAKFLRSQGMTIVDICEKLGYSYSAVSAWVNPRTKANRDASRRRREAAKRALRRENQARAVKRYGNEEIEATFNFIRKSLDAAQRGYDNATEPEMREGIRDTQNHLYKAEAAILAMLKIK